MANSTTEWWTRSSPAIRTGLGGKWRTANHSLVTESPPRTFSRRNLGHRELSRSRSPSSLWVSRTLWTSYTTVRQKRGLHSYDSLTGMRSVRPIDVSIQLLTPVRFNVPNAESYAASIQGIDTQLSSAGTEEERRELGGKKSSHVWKGLRLASKKQLSSFDRIEHGKGLEALQPVTSSIEATGNDTAPTNPDDKGSDPHAEHHSVEEQRADQHSQVTTETTA